MRQMTIAPISFRIGREKGEGGGGWLFKREEASWFDGNIYLLHNCIKIEAFLAIAFGS